jgi:malate synthase
MNISQLENLYPDIFDSKLISILEELHLELNDERKKLLLNRENRQKNYDRGEKPGFLDSNSEACSSDWKISYIPEDLICRRVEITGPVNSAKMVINMLSRNDLGFRADLAMLDFEDSMKPTFSNVISGYRNVISASKYELSYQQGDKFYSIDKDDSAKLMVRVRGLHLEEKNVLIDGNPISAGLLDLVICFYKTYSHLIKEGKTPKYYIPKCEHYLEARWWEKLFSSLEKKLSLPNPTLRVTFLIETLPASYQVEEILYEVRNHVVGLNVGRWDKIFSDIKILKNHSDKVLADRSSITMKKYWMENYAKRIIKICHSRGAFAMGGMSAFTPGKTLEEREIQTSKVLEDKKREFELGHDGCWLSHPYFIGPALSCFTSINQLGFIDSKFDKYSDILPSSIGPKTLRGLETNIRVGIAYIQGWNAGLGCISWDGLMEDLATLEISRAQVWQWIKHGVKLDEGIKVTKILVKNIFDLELKKILSETPDNLHESFIKSKEDAERVFLMDDLPNFLGDVLF